MERVRDIPQIEKMPRFWSIIAIPVINVVVVVHVILVAVWHAYDRMKVAWATKQTET